MSGRSKKTRAHARARVSRLIAISAVVLMNLLGLAHLARAERIKDLATVQGVRVNQLVGYGLVVGLAQTGDDYNVPFTQQSILALLRRMGLPATDPTNLHARDTAAVLVTATVPPFARNGSAIDVTVAAMGSAISLQGGMLISTPLRAGDGRVYAVAQGPLLIGGLLAAGASGSMSQRNHVTTGGIPGGAIIEKDLPSGLKTEQLTFLLRHPDFTTANRISSAIERSLSAPAGGAPAGTGAPGSPAPAAAAPVGTVRAIDAGTVEVRVGKGMRDRIVALAAQLEEIDVEADLPARIVVNERSGVVVIGDHVTLGSSAVSYGRLTVKIDEAPVASQPNALAGGQTVVVQRSKVKQNEARNALVAVGPATKVEDVVLSLNQLGASTRDLISVLQALKAAGALRGELLIE